MALSELIPLSVVLLAMGIIFFAACAFFADYAKTSHSLLPSPTLLSPQIDPGATPSTVDRQCEEQVLIYLLENVPTILEVFGWLTLRVYILWRLAHFIAQEVMEPIAAFYVKKAYR
ncbi:unnamed protein product [Penicillium glandicola]